MTPIDKLRSMLDEAKITYENNIEPMEQPDLFFPYERRSLYGQAGKFRWNQVIYGRYGDNSWLLDAIWQYGSYGCTQGMLETYGTIGVDKDNQPMVLSPEEVFEIIRKDWEKTKGGGKT